MVLQNYIFKTFLYTPLTVWLQHARSQHSYYFHILQIC